MNKKENEKKNEEEINEKEMLAFYKNLDVIKLKYDLKEPGTSEDDKGKTEKRRGEDYGSFINDYARIEAVEDMLQADGVTRVEYGDILSNLDLIYGTREKSDEIVELFDLIRSKIIYKYIGIEGLERLFSEKYIDFEWDMHLGIDYKAHQMEFYRDHFVHQIRNAYCMHILLERFDWLDRIEKVLLNKEHSKISQYVWKSIRKQVDRGYHTKLKEYNNEEFYCRNIIYMSSYMAALFHDIGYPEVTNSVNQQRIVEYIPNLYNMESTGYNYPRLHTLLQNSLLFRIVPFTEIKQKLAGQKIDHGCLSAIIFLLNFYENGAVQGLEPYKKCAVELAALAIYNHTNKYRYNNKIKAGEYVRNQFALNPVSYVLRLCDDLQEWGRIYFELSNKSNLIICNRCKTPIVRKQSKDKNGHVKWFYKCNCFYTKKSGTDEERGLFTPVFDYESNFSYRRIYNVTVCDSLKIEETGGVLTFDLDYRLDRLLHIAYINSDYAVHRVDELNKFKKILDYQPELPKMKVKYFMSANPILIKTVILEKYLNAENDVKIVELFGSLLRADTAVKTERERLMQHAENEFQNIQNSYSNIIMLEARKTYAESSEFPRILDTVYLSVRLYTKLLILMGINKQNHGGTKISKVFLNDLFEKMVYMESIGFISDDLRGLINDCSEQFGRMYADISQITPNPKEYYSQFEATNYTYGCIKRFLNAKHYEPTCGRTKEQIDGYTDLALFRTILENIDGK